MKFRHHYDDALVGEIARKAIELKATHAKKRHLNLTFIRGAHRYIPEIAQLIEWPGRRELISDLAGVELEPYPISVISSIITFQDSGDDSSIVWHADGIPVTEMIPLDIDNLVGGELEIYRGDYEEGLSLRNAAGFPEPHRIIKVQHDMGYSILGQLMRTTHRVSPIRSGRRITLNLNWRSVAHPWIDDNTLTYLAADNPDLSWQEEYLNDIREVHIPAYVNSVARQD